MKRRRNRGGNRGAAPAMLKLRERMYLFAPAIIWHFAARAIYVLSHKSLSEWLPGLIAGLQESSPEEPKMHQNHWRPQNPLGSLQCSSRPPSWWGEPFGLQASAPSGLALAPQCGFHSDATEKWEKCQQFEGYKEVGTTQVAENQLPWSAVQWRSFSKVQPL